MKNYKKQESQTALPNLPSPKNSVSYELTPSEVASLRQEFRDDANWMAEQLGIPARAAIMTNSQTTPQEAKNQSWKTETTPTPRTGETLGDWMDQLLDRPVNPEYGRLTREEWMDAWGGI